MISFKNLTKKTIRYAIFKKLYKKIFLPDGKAGLKKFDLSIVFAPPLFMAKLNKKYKDKQKPVDVLTFLIEKGQGEIFLNAREQNLPGLFIHGALHLLGYGHETESQAELMQKKEKGLFKSLKS